MTAGLIYLFLFENISLNNKFFSQRVIPNHVEVHRIVSDIHHITHDDNTID